MTFRGNTNTAAATGARPMTPQLWHPDNDNNRRRSHESDSALDEVDDEDRHRNKEGALGEGDDDDQPKIRKKRKNLAARIRSWRKPDPIYKVKGTGRLAQFSNERLFLHWIRFGILQGGIAVMLLNFGNEIAGMVGVVSLVLALLTLLYGTTLYHLRHIYMITKRPDVVYFSRRVPTLLCIALFLIYLTNFIITMTIGKDWKSTPPWTKNDPSNPNSVFNR
ncbi:hypothetical protein BGZ96_000371 [Linnemannia gamsii]|uniref:DUF202 domain-containing protein n=1 Tax=Linnemannia gamsii TaxID=64522 RepID=A0ABQ7JPD9_9FUNG|nr:hypothetical protein BGZ96_000371 [Linnemannia gamsii]